MKEKFKVNTLKLFLCFLALMFIMTFVSRMLYTSKLPKVMTVGVKIQGITHTVECRGTLDPIKKTPVFVPDGLRISDIFVKKGDTVSDGDLLMQLDEQYLSQMKTSLEKELEDKLRNSPEAYYSDSKTPVFTESGLRVSEICVNQGDYVEKGKLLVRLDINFLYNYIADLENDLNADYVTRQGYYDQEDTRSADVISNLIAQKERKLQRYNDVASNNGEIYSNIAGTVTDLSVKSGSVTGDSAVACISDNTQLHYSVIDMKQRLDKLRAIESSEGKILSSFCGVISEVSLNIGDITAETAAFIVSDTSSGMIFNASVDDKDTNHIAVGDMVSLSFRNGRIKLDECEVKVFLKDDTDGSYHVQIPVENNQLNIGETGQMSLTVVSDNKYDCLPVSAVTEKSEKRGYIYALEEIEGFLGPEYSISMIDVNIADKNDIYYGLSELGLDPDTQIVVSSSKELYNGQKVRMS